MFLGILLILLGILLLLEKAGVIYGDIWDYIWPVALIALGGSMMFKNRNSIEKDGN